jgi:hypothetical protein
MAVPYTFGTATAAIPLSQLDSNFATAITLGNTAVYLGNTTTSIGNLTLTNVTISSGSVTITDTTVSGNVTLSGGTANGVAYLNGSKVLTTGSALTFDGANALNMGVANAGGYNTVGINNPSSTGYARMLLSIGASGATGLGGVSYAPGVFFKIGTDTDTSSTPMTFLLGNGSEQMRLTSTGLGIGTSSPSNKLHVKLSSGGNTAQFEGAGASDSFIAITNTGISNTYVGFNNSGSTNSSGIPSGVSYFSNINGYPLAFSTGSAERMRLDASGNLGLGVTPSAWGSGVKSYQSTGSVFFAGDTRTYFSSNVFLNSSYASTYIASRYALQYYQDATGGTHSWYNAPSGTAGNAITFTQAMTLDASGNLLVGGTTAGAKVRIETNLVSQDGLDIKNTSATTGQTFVAFFNSTNGVAGSITQPTSTTVAYNVTSDQRLKENIQDAEDASALLDAIQVRQYDWKSDGSHQRFGFVAQELANVAPEAVHQPNDPDKTWGVDYSKLVPMLVKEIQSLRKRLTALEGKA